MFSKTALIEAVKEFFRWELLAVLATIVPLTLSGINTQSGVLLFNYPLIRANLVFITIVSIAKALDKYVHENESIKSNGIIPF